MTRALPPVRTDVDSVRQAGVPAQVIRRCSPRSGPALRDVAPTPTAGIAPTAYDTAWLAGLTVAGTPRFPAALRWLIDHQHEDGSWGGAIRYEHDRILSTLAALGTLARAGEGDGIAERLARGTRYLWEHGPALAGEPMELVGFELLLPALIRRAAGAGIAVPPDLDIYGPQRAEKLRLIPSAAIYTSATTLVHSLEFLGEDADPARLPATVGPDGSVGSSPAATAFYYERTGDPSVLPYLRRCLDRFGGSSVPVLWPADRFESLWAAYHLWLAGVPAARLIPPAERARLRTALAGGGVSLADSFPIPDADDTAVALMLLRAAGDPVDARVLGSFAGRDGHFVSFPHERHSSVGVNVHVLHALLTAPEYPDRAATIDRLIAYLLDSQIDGRYWLDKWHISPYYATAHAVAVAAEIPPGAVPELRPAIDRALSWIRETQKPDGTWGFYGESTAEETAYAALALACWDRAHGLATDRARCRVAARALIGLIGDGAGAPESHPPLWIDKCLYRPTTVVEAVIRSALLACRIAA